MWLFPVLSIFTTLPVQMAVSEEVRRNWFCRTPGQAKHKGPVYIWEATVEAAQRRLDYMLGVLRSENLDVDETLGDYRLLRALANAVARFKPDELVISTLPASTPPGSGTTSSPGPAPPTTSLDPGSVLGSGPVAAVE